MCEICTWVAHKIPGVHTYHTGARKKSVKLAGYGSGINGRAIPPILVRHGGEPSLRDYFGNVLPAVPGFRRDPAFHQHIMDINCCTLDIPVNTNVNIAVGTQSLMGIVYLHNSRIWGDEFPMTCCPHI